MQLSTMIAWLPHYTMCKTCPFLRKGRFFYAQRRNLITDLRVKGIYFDKISTFLHFKVTYTNSKAAICSPQIAAFLLSTKNLYFRLLVYIKFPSIFMQIVEADKPGIVAFFGYSSGCRSPPSVLVFHKKIKTEVYIWKGSI